MMPPANRQDLAQSANEKAAGGEPTAASVDPRMARVCADMRTLVSKSSHGVEAVGQNRTNAFMQALPR
jgi:hypothetical protein